MAIDPSAVWDFAKEVVGAARRDSGRTLATVTRIDADGTTWVTTGDGGEAPAGSVGAGVSMGDTVTLEWDGSAMGIRGNVSNPSPAGSVVRRAVARAQGVADAAQRVADAVNQHFWHDDNGAHVTMATQEEWDASHSGPNSLWNSLGMLFRDGLNNMLTLTTENNARALTIWDGLGNAAANVRAVFGEVITLGTATSGNYVTIDSSGMDVTKGGSSVANFGASARIGKSNGTRVTVGTSEVKIIPSNKTSNALTFTATDDSARIDYGSNYLSIGDLLLGYDCALDVMGNTWVSSGGLHVGGSASSGNYRAQVTSAGTVRASGAIYATDDPTDTSDPSLVAGLVGTSSFIILRADEGGTGNRWRFNKAGRDIGYYNGTDWDTVCPMPAMTAAISGGTDKSLTTSYANLNLAAVTTVASALTISGGGIKCTKAGRVMISASAYFADVNAGNVCNVRVLIGSTVAAFVSDRAYSDRCQMVIPPRITTVDANDVIYMAVANTSTAAGSVEGTRTQTWMTVQYVAYN